MKVPFFDPRPQHAPLAAELQRAFAGFLDEPRFILGEHVAQFERAAAEQLQVAHAIGVSSGTDALLCSLLALGVGPGDEVITTPFTFAATAEVIVRVGALPRFVDVDPGSLNIDVTAVEQAITPRTRAVLPVHLFGSPLEMTALLQLAERHGVAVVEDAAQAWGACYRSKPVGGLGRLGAFSFFPSKPLGGWGDGGLIVTQDAELAERCRQLRSHGKNARGEFEVLGGNFRLDALQAALLAVKLQHVEQWQRERTEIAEEYSRGLTDVPGLRLPQSSTQGTSAWSVYTLRIATNGERNRDAVRAALQERGVATAIYYSRPLHCEPAFQDNARQSLPVAEQAAREVLSLPIFPGLSAQQRAHVIQQLRAICGA
ncbi:MAG TPA: DegT/DnrJ/EryC1/StrS family aminotransferase [Polyangiaceae bacterium]|nr:DegT/DnrJ/EryC1/StrS family aminotransferase [Polyangiaceae bacterium]